MHSGHCWMYCSVCMNSQILAEELLKNSVLDATDAARLVLEMQDALIRRTKKRSKPALMKLFRRVIYAGTECVEQEEQTVCFKTAAWASIDARTTRLRKVSLRDLRYYVRRMLRVEGCSRMLLRHMNTARCRYILESAFAQSSSEYVKGRSIMHSIFAYGIRREWCDANPVTRIEVPHVQESIIEPLSPDAAGRLLECARNTDMHLSVCLLLFSGIRPAEVSRLNIEDICWKEKQVYIRSQTSKTGGGRVVPLRGCDHIPPGLRVIPRNWHRRWQAIRLQAGFTKWVPDVCRHTFASYHAAYFRNLPALQLEMGHCDLHLLRSRYMRPVNIVPARKFWALTKEKNAQA